jgi:hypothetical protein
MSLPVIESISESPNGLTLVVTVVPADRAPDASQEAQPEDTSGTTPPFGDIFAYTIRAEAEQLVEPREHMVGSWAGKASARTGKGKIATAHATKYIVVNQIDGQSTLWSTPVKGGIEIA